MSRSVYVDLVGAAGICLTVYGAWLAWNPLGYIVCGVCLAAFCVFAKRQPDSKKRGDS